MIKWQLWKIIQAKKNLFQKVNPMPPLVGGGRRACWSLVFRLVCCGPQSKQYRKRGAGGIACPAVARGAFFGFIDAHLWCELGASVTLLICIAQVGRRGEWSGTEKKQLFTRAVHTPRHVRWTNPASGPTLRWTWLLQADCSGSCAPPK